MKNSRTKKSVIILLTMILGSFLLYGVIFDRSKYAPMGYSLQMDFAGEEVPTFMADVEVSLNLEIHFPDAPTVSTP